MKKFIILLLMISFFAQNVFAESLSYVDNTVIIIDNLILFDESDNQKEAVIDDVTIYFDSDFINNYRKGVRLDINHDNNTNIVLDEDARYYNFVMTDYNGNPINEFSNITIKIKCEDFAKTFLYYINDSGVIESIPSTFENGEITFNTNHFSTFVITNRKYDQILLNKKIEAKENINPIKYNKMHKMVGILGEFIIISGTLFLYVYIKKRLGNK